MSRLLEFGRVLLGFVIRLFLAIPRPGIETHLTTLLYSLADDLKGKYA